MIPMLLADVAAAIGVEVPASVARVTVSSVEFDSRKVRPGSLFVALSGEHADGHDFAGAAARAGAVAVLGSRAVAELPTLVAPGAPPAADVPGTPGKPTRDGDTAVLAALSALARHVCTRLVADGLTVIGVTGSAGKTSTKDLIAAVLARAGTVVAPPESFNNELGHPYTVLRADARTDFLVLELSARGRGHIAALATIAPPRIGVVLNVGSAHLGEFGSRDAIAEAKGELVEALPAAAAGGVAILNVDDDRVAAMDARTVAAVVGTGISGAASVRAEDIALDGAARASFTLVTPEGSARVGLRVVGGHQVPNALAAAAVGRAVGMDVVTVAAALSAAGASSKWRMAVTELPGGVTVVNDAYNANPESMRAAIEALSRIGAGRNRWAVLGEMAELGATAPSLHREIGAVAQRSGAQVLAVGAGARGIFDGANEVFDVDGGLRPVFAGGIDTAATLLSSLVEQRDVVLIKASRTVGLERLADRLIEARTPSGGAVVWPRNGGGAT